MGLDDSNFRRRTAEWVRRTPKAEKYVVSKMAGEFVGKVLSNSPTDTNRYIRGWIKAANAASIGTAFALPPLRRSKLADVLAVRLESQLRKWEKALVDAEQFAKFWTDLYQKRYVATGRRGKWATDCRNKMNKAIRRRDKVAEIVRIATEQLAEYNNGDGAQIVIFGRKTKGEFAKSRLTTVRAKIYGGDAKWLTVKGRTLLELHNLEAHASLVENHRGVVRRAMSSVRSIGLKKYSARAIKIIDGK